MIATLLSVATAGATTSVATAGATTSPLLDASPFGHALRKDFLFADNTTQFNHGSYGGIPRKVLDAQYEYVKALEQNVLQRIDSAWYRDRLIAVRKRLGEYINAPWEDVVLVDNASNAINVLLSMMWKFESDEVLLDFSTAYGPFKAYYEWLHATRGINTVAVDLHFPLSGPQPVLDALEKTLASIKASNKKVSVCVVSQVSSAPAVLLPIAEIVARLKKDGVPTIVDGAHALGATKIDVQAMGEPAFWFGNAHKWLYAPRAACALYVSKPYQGKYFPEPTVVDSFGDAFADRFVWSGTRDRSVFLAVGDAFDYREAKGGGGAAGEAALMTYVQTLSREGAAVLVKAWGTGLLAPDSMQAMMHNVIVPVNGSAACGQVQSGLWAKGVQIYVPFVDGLCYVRAHAQIYLELSDYANLGRMVKEIIHGLQVQPAE